MKIVVLRKGNITIPSRPISDEQVENTAQEGMKFYAADSYEVRDYVTPGDCGCWFCSTKTDDMMFDTEFDTFLHKDCLIQALRREPDHPEARLMAYLLEEDNESEEDLPL